MNNIQKLQLVKYAVDDATSGVFDRLRQTIETANLPQDVQDGHLQEYFDLRNQFADHGGFPDGPPTGNIAPPSIETAIDMDTLDKPVDMNFAGRGRLGDLFGRQPEYPAITPQSHMDIRAIRNDPQLMNQFNRNMDVLERLIGTGN